MKNKHWTGKPLDSHAECLNQACNRYFNIHHKDTNQLCKPCNKKYKEKLKKGKNE